LTIDAEYVYLLEKIVPDLYKNEGLWYVEIEFFLENKIPIK
jgi:histone demethylase